MDSFQIKSQLLRQKQLEPGAALDVFARRRNELADDTVVETEKAKPSWRQADVRRLLNAAEQAGLQSYRVEITPEGALAIVVGVPQDSAPPERT